MNICLYAKIHNYRWTCVKSLKSSSRFLIRFSKHDEECYSVWYCGKWGVWERYHWDLCPLRSRHTSILQAAHREPALLIGNVSVDTAFFVAHLPVPGVGRSRVGWRGPPAAKVTFTCSGTEIAIDVSAVASRKSSKTAWIGCTGVWTVPVGQSSSLHFTPFIYSAPFYWTCLCLYHAKMHLQCLPFRVVWHMPSDRA